MSLSFSTQVPCGSDRGILHRDISAGNILTHDSPSHPGVLADMELAKILDTATDPRLINIREFQIEAREARPNITVGIWWL
jgi:hypothetical protein